MTLFSRGRTLPIAVGTCLAVGLGSVGTAAAAPTDGAAHAAKATTHGHGVKASKKAKPTKKPVSKKPAGNSMMSGSRAPGKSQGATGDFYLRTSDRTLYGPKTKRGWGKPTSLVGPQGAPGAQGLVGPQGIAGIPAFGAGQVTTVPAPSPLTGTYDIDGNLSGPPTQVATVMLPAGPSLVQIRLRTTAGAGWTANSSVSCDVTTPFGYAVGAGTFDGQMATDAIGWISTQQATPAAVRCNVNSYDGTPGATVSADVSGTQVVVYPLNVPAA